MTVKAQHNTPIQTLIVDLVENILKSPDNPGACGRYITTQIREIIGVELVALVSCENETAPQLISICPERKSPEWSRPEIQRFLAAALLINEPRIIDPLTDPIGESLRSLGIGKSFVIPLQVGEEKVGLLLLLVLLDEHGAASILGSLDSISKILALILKNSRQYLDLEQLIVRRTAQLSKSEKFFRAIFEQSAVGVALLNTATGRYLETNKRFCEIIGYSPQELRNLDFKAITHQDDLGVNFEYMEQLKAGQIYEYSLEKRYIHRNGRTIWVNITVSPLWDEGSEPDYHIAIVLDISERKQFESSLKDSEFFFRESQRAASIGSYKTDFIAGVWESSEVLDTVFGIGRDYTRSVQGWMDIVHPDDQKMMTQYVQEEVIARGKRFSKEYRIIRKNDAETRWVYGLGEVTLDPTGKAVSMIGTIQDITERKKTAEENARLEAQLQQAQKMESVGRLAGGVAHDFNNMLGVIIGNAELALMKKEMPEPAVTALKEIKKAAERSAELTRQLLAFARKQTVAPKVLDLNESVSGMLSILRRLIGENIDLTWQPMTGLWLVRIDPSQIDQILANLCVNARDAIAGNGTISIMADNRTIDANYCKSHPDSYPDDFVRITVSDDGHGMDKETVARIFEPFFTTKGVGEGTGMGMATVYGIARQNNGFINVYSEPGLGTTFTIYLPRHLGKEEQSGKEGLVKTVAPGEECILLVEDDPAILAMTAEILRMNGYTVLTAATPGEAISLAREHSGEIHLLMTDVVMPEMNGRDLAKAVLSIYPKLRRLFMSGYTADIIAHHGVIDEGLNFIQKPFSIQDLAVKVREVLDHENLG